MAAKIEKKRAQKSEENWQKNKRNEDVKQGITMRKIEEQKRDEAVRKKINRRAKRKSGKKKKDGSCNQRKF